MNTLKSISAHEGYLIREKIFAVLAAFLLFTVRADPSSSIQQHRTASEAFHVRDTRLFLSLSNRRGFLSSAFPSRGSLPVSFRSKADPVPLSRSEPQRQAVPHALRPADGLRGVHQRQLRVHVVQQHEAVRGLERLRGLLPLRAVHGVVHHEQLSA